MRVRLEELVLVLSGLFQFGHGFLLIGYCS
jgi:hypothetical protein